MAPLVDTSIIVDYLRGQEQAADCLDQLGDVYISAITVAEVYQGAKDKTNLRKLDQTLQAFRVLPITPEITNQALVLIRKFVLSHHLLILDALIAATALQHKTSLATQNTKHFRMIKELEVLKLY